MIAYFKYHTKTTKMTKNTDKNAYDKDGGNKSEEIKQGKAVTNCNCNETDTETTNTHKIDWTTFKHAFLDIFALLFAAVSLVTGCIIIILSYVALIENAWTYDQSCRNNDDSIVYFNDIITGCFVIASSMTKLSGHLTQDLNSFQYVLFAFMAIPCVYFTSVILWG